MFLASLVTLGACAAEVGKAKRAKNGDSLVSTDKPRGGPWAQVVMPNWTVFSRVAADYPSAAQAPKVRTAGV
jgi:hypothetical protein